MSFEVANPEERKRIRTENKRSQKKKSDKKLTNQKKQKLCLAN